MQWYFWRKNPNKIIPVFFFDTNLPFSEKQCMHFPAKRLGRVKERIEQGIAQPLSPEKMDILTAREKFTFLIFLDQFLEFLA